MNETDDEARPAARAVPDRAVLTDAQWARLAPLLPPQPPKTGSRGGRPNTGHRLVVEGMLWILRTGAPWRDLPKDYGPHSTVANRFYRWWRAGILERVFAALLADGDARGALDWLLHYLDGTVVRAHQHAAGAPKGATLHDAQAREALGRSRGGLTTKLPVRAEGGGKPVAFVVSPGQRHECRYAEALLDQGAVKRPGRGRPRLRPERVAGDKGYSYPHVRRALRRRGIGAVIPTRKDQRRNPHFDRAAYRTRERVERLINRLKQFRRVATRYEKRGHHYLAFVTLAAIILWLPV